MTESAEKEVGDLTDLPGSIIGEPADLHAMRSATRPGSRVSVIGKPIWLTMASASGKLDCQALTHKVGSIFEYLISQGPAGFGHGNRWYPWEGRNVRKAGGTESWSADRSDIDATRVERGG